MTMHSGAGFSEGAGPGRLLIVDDDLDFTRRVSTLLGNSGFEIDLTTERDQALERLQTFAPQVAIVDIRIGRDNDFELIRRLSDLRPDLLSIMSTPSADLDAAIAALHAGAFDYLRKPVDEHELLAKLKRCFDSIRVEKRLRQAQRMEAIGTLAGGIAHDFNNILAAILGYSELARLDLKENERARDNLDKVLQAGYRAKDLVAQILAISRRAEQEKTPVLISAILKEVLKLMRASLPTTIEIRQSIPGDFGNIFADPAQIHQVLVNICTHAGRAMGDSGGTLNVCLDLPEDDSDFARHFGDKKPQDYIRLTIADTGHGMPPEVLERILDPSCSAEEGERGGTDLGLALARGIVKNHHGHVAVRSAVGQGTTFIVYLPRVVERIVSRRPRDLEPLPCGEEQILLVDDEPDIADMQQQRLTRLGYNVSTYTESPKALDAFLADPQRFDLVITDMTMPVMTGDRLAVTIRRANSTVPIILCTGYNENINADTAREIGISCFLSKPLAFEALARTIRQLLDEHTGDNLKL